jgi:undecaprenyl-diphosphatase
MTAPLLLRLHARDRALMLRCVIAPSAPRRARLAWSAITHLGGTSTSILAAAVPWFACCDWHEGSRVALATLVGSHLVVQVIKRTAGRARPSELETAIALVREPDRFSFPSGHAAAAMSVALGYGSAFPLAAAPLVALALLVGFSRVRLGVHFPGDVLAGQLISLTTLATILLVS